MLVDHIRRLEQKGRRETHDAPLILWRSVRLGSIDLDTISHVKHALAGPIALPHRRWPAARRGDAAAAIAVALDLGRRPELGMAVADLALSCVLVAAWQGDAAAQVVLAHARSALTPVERASCRPVAGRRRRFGAPGR